MRGPEAGTHLLWPLRGGGGAADFFMALKSTHWSCLLDGSWKAQVWSDKSLLRPHPPALLNSPVLFGAAVSSEGHVNISIKIHTF